MDASRGFQGGFCYQAAQAASCQRACAADPCRAGTPVAGIFPAHRQRRVSATERLGSLHGNPRLPATCPDSAEFRHSQTPRLPMLIVRRGSEGTDTKPPKAQPRLPQPRGLRRPGNDPRAGEKDRVTGKAQAGATNDRSRLLTASARGNESKRANWRACDEGLHNWTGREDL